MIRITTVAKSRYRVEYQLHTGFAVASDGDLEASVATLRRHMIHMLAIANGQTVPVPTEERKGS